MANSSAAATVSSQRKAASIFPIVPNEISITNMQVYQYFHRILAHRASPSVVTCGGNTAPICRVWASALHVMQLIMLETQSLACSHIFFLRCFHPCSASSAFFFFCLFSLCSSHTSYSLMQSTEHLPLCKCFFFFFPLYVLSLTQYVQQKPADWVCLCMHLHTVWLCL